MLKEDHGKIRFKRREFLKTTTFAGMAISVPGATLFKENPIIIDEWYEQLADALNKLPNSFPRTKSNIEIALLKKIFLPEEAYLAGKLTGTIEPVEVIARRTDLTEEETASRLKSMMARGLVRGNTSKGMYRLSSKSCQIRKKGCGDDRKSTKEHNRMGA